MSAPRIAIFGPDPLLSVTIETRSSGEELHLHPAGQGVWVARMARELGASPILCSFLGGETGALLEPLLTANFEVRVARTSGVSGSYVVDRRGDERNVLASALRPAPQRHEVDDLLSSTVAAALGSEVLVICNPYPADGIPNEVYETLVADVRAAGVPVLVDLSSPRLDHALRHQPDLVKLNDWELAEFVRGPVDGRRMLAGAQALIDAGAGAVVVTQAEGPVLVLSHHADPFEVVPPVFPVGHREGCGDTMMGAIAAGWARGLPLRDLTSLGVAAGSINFLRRGLGTGSRSAVEELARTIVVRPLLEAASKTAV
ncbi:MAG TPA: PfkB family carbohydrate kinase [Solirubrobacteraceae bacterium]|nr:PfkB family carbohydrate kinase [Solirubrobacteraceae bacterium]